MVEESAKARTEMVRKCRGFHPLVRDMQMKIIKIAGSSAIKLYLVKTARPKADPTKAAFCGVEVLSDRNLSKKKRTRTNNGIVVQSVPIVTAWIIRTGKKVRKKMKPKWIRRDANRRCE